jgi:hypothetical protein
MAITPSDRKISQMTEVAPSAGMYVPLVDLTQLPSMQNVRATIGDILALVPPTDFADITGKPTTLSGYGITDAQPLDGDLTALAALTGTNTIYYRSAASTWSAVTIGSNLTFIAGVLAASGGGTGTVTSVNITPPASGITASGGPVTTAGSITLTLADDLAALEALSGTDTIYYRSGASTWTAVTIGSNLTFTGGVLAATGGGGSVAAEDVTYDNVASGLTATNAQDAFDEIASYFNIAEGVSETLTYSSDGDTNGLFYFIGTDYLSTSWSNPSTSGEITIVVKTTDTGAPSDLVDRTTNQWYTAPVANSYAGVDIGNGRTMSITKYTIRNRTEAQDMLRTWRLQGSNNVSTNTTGGFDAATWVDIDVRSGDTSITSLNQFVTFTANQSNTNSYRWFRLIQDGVNSNGANYLCFAEWEFYGEFSAPGGVLLKVENGGTGVATAAANTIFSGPTTGAAAAPAFRALVASDIPSLSSVYQPLDAALTALSTGSDFVVFSGPATSNKTFTLPNASATILTSNAAVTAAQGGTGFTSYTEGDLIYGNSGGGISKLPIQTLPGYILFSGATPSWAQLSTLAVTALAGTANEITASASTGSLTLSLPASLTFTGKTVTGGTFNSGAFNGTVGATTPSTAIFTTLTASESLSLAYKGISIVNTAATGYAQLNLQANAASVAKLAQINWAPSLFLKLVSPDTTPILAEVNGSTVGTFTTTGFQGAIGATTPSTVACTTLTVNGKAVSEGAADSGGVGFKLLRVPN